MSRPRLVLVRHGITAWNREGRFQGHSDPPLSDAGRAEAELAAARLAADPALRPARIVASDLERAFATAAALGRAVGATPVADARWREIGQGEWEGRTHAELEVDDAERYRAWREASGLRQPPGGEAIDDARARVVEALDELAAGDAWPACVVSHGGLLRIVATVLLGEIPPPLDVDNASISVVNRRSDGQWQLERWNDVGHLLGRRPTHMDEAEGRPLAL